MKKLSDTFVNESKGEVMRLLNNMDNSKLWNCFFDFFNNNAAVDFLSDCFWSDKKSMKEAARNWVINTMLDEELSMDDLKRGGWC